MVTSVSVCSSLCYFCSLTVCASHFSFLDAGFTRREPKGGLLKGGLHFHDFSQSDVSPLASAYFSQ